MATLISARDSIVYRSKQIAEMIQMLATANLTDAEREDLVYNIKIQQKAIKALEKVAK